MSSSARETPITTRTFSRPCGWCSKGAKLIGTNSDLTGPAEDGIIPACRAMIAPIEMATGQTAYFVGKPNPLMMRTGLRILGVHSEDAVMIGDRMDTDMVAGIETGLDTDAGSLGRDRPGRISRSSRTVRSWC